MNILLIFFALPVATILLAIVLEKILRCPILTAITFFAIYLIVAFAIFDASFLVFVIIYTILAFITAVIAEFFFRRCWCQERKKCNCCQRNNENNNGRRINDADITRIANELLAQANNQNGSCGCSNQNTPTVARVNVRDNTGGNQTSWCCYRR